VPHPTPKKFAKDWRIFGKKITPENPTKDIRNPNLEIALFRCFLDE